MGSKGTLLLSMLAITRMLNREGSSGALAFSLRLMPSRPAAGATLTHSGSSAALPPLFFPSHGLISFTANSTLHHDNHGNTGKSWFARYLVACNEAVIFTPGKMASMELIVIFDLSRTQADKIDHVYCIWPRFRSGAQIKRQTPGRHRCAASVVAATAPVLRYSPFPLGSFSPLPPTPPAAGPVSWGTVQRLTAKEKKASKTKKVSSRGHELQRSVGRMRDVQQLRYAWRQSELLAPGAIGDAPGNPFRAQPARAHAAHSRL